MNSERDTLYDARIVERNIARGKISKEEYEAYLASIPDDADLQETSAISFVHSRIVGPQWNDDDGMADEDDLG